MGNAFREPRVGTQSLRDGMIEATQQDDPWDDKRIVFNDHPMTDKEIRTFLELPSTVAATRLVAEGRVHSRWAEDVKRYKHRTESMPIPGKPWPMASVKAKKSSTEDVEEDNDDDTSESEDQLSDH